MTVLCESTSVIMSLLFWANARKRASEALSCLRIDCSVRRSSSTRRHATTVKNKADISTKTVSWMRSHSA